MSEKGECRFFKKKYGQAPFIAPLQLFTLAMFPSWGSSKGAGRKRLTHGAKVVFFLIRRFCIRDFFEHRFVMCKKITLGLIFGKLF